MIRRYRSGGAAERSFAAAMSNSSGHLLENMVARACAWYYANGRAKIAKMPEPFRVLEKDRATNIARIRFVSHAQPDFIGCLEGGRCIVFETKYTRTDKLHNTVLTETQAASLEAYHRQGAIAAVCAGIQDKYFFIPWGIFSDMKKLFGRQYVKAADIAAYQVKAEAVVFFLDYLDKDTGLTVFS